MQQQQRFCFRISFPIPTMCLIALRYWFPPSNSNHNSNDRESDDVPQTTQPTPSILLVSNRDEVYARPSQAAHYWDLHFGNDDDNNGNKADEQSDNGPDSFRIYGGRDLVQGGSWLAVSSTGRLAALTNYHENLERGKTWPRSRGDIVSTFVGNGRDGNADDKSYIAVAKSAVSKESKETRSLREGDDTTDPSGEVQHSKPWFKCTAVEFCTNFLLPKKDDYAGFSAILFDGTDLVCVSNRHDSSSFYRVLQPGQTYGLSNHLLDTPWPKTCRAKASVTLATSAIIEQYNNDQKQQTTDDSGSTDVLPDRISRQLLNDFADTEVVDDPSLLPTTLSLEEEHLRSSLCVRGPFWGTRTTTIVYLDDTQRAFTFIERNHDLPSHGLRPSFTKKVIRVSS